MTIHFLCLDHAGSDKEGKESPEPKKLHMMDTRETSRTEGHRSSATSPTNTEAARPSQSAAPPQTETCLDMTVSATSPAMCFVAENQASGGATRKVSAAFLQLDLRQDTKRRSRSATLALSAHKATASVIASATATAVGAGSEPARATADVALTPVSGEAQPASAPHQASAADTALGAASFLVIERLPHLSPRFLHPGVTYRTSDSVANKVLSIHESLSCKRLSTAEATSPEKDAQAGLRHPTGET